MTRRNNAGRLFAASLGSLFVAGFAFPIHAQDVFNGLPYDENFIQEKLIQHTVTARSADAATDIPANLLYRLVFKAILTDEELQARISVDDLELIKNLPAPADHSFLAKDQKEITALCVASNNTDTPAEILDLATRYDNSRKRKDHDLDVFYATSLSGLAEETRQLIHDLMQDFSSRNNLTYAILDMAGFAQDVPEAAKAMMIGACENFSAQIISYTPQTVKLGDLYL